MGTQTKCNFAEKTFFHESARKLVQQPDTGNAEKRLVLRLLENLGWLLFERSNPKLMEINCPSCNEAVLIADEDMTTTIECPFCQQPIEFDEPEPPPVKDVPPLVEKPPWPFKDEPESALSEETKRALTSDLIIQCPACGKAVSKQADICPSCGHPIYAGVLGKAGASRIINITLLVLLVACVFFCLIANPFIRP